MVCVFPIKQICTGILIYFGQSLVFICMVWEATLQSAILKVKPESFGVVMIFVW